MKNILFFVFSISTLLSHAQQIDTFSAIKLYVPNDAMRDQYRVPENIKTRLVSKLTQIINHTGVAETGYSNFVVIPKFEIINVWEDNAGLAKIYLAECELLIVIQRRSYSIYDKEGPATFDSYSKKIVGSSTNRETALTSAISSISPSDPGIIAFFGKAKDRINAYFLLHCEDVMKEASQAMQLNDLSKAISLYFSVPSKAPCYIRARDSSLKLYEKYLEKECNKKLIRLKAAIARAQNTDMSAENYYDSVFNIMMDMEPSLEDCYAEAEKLMEKIEKRFDEKQKREWELRKKSLMLSADIQKERIRSMREMNRSYAPASHIIITN